jgi:phosphoglycerate dehydrogenase-like enzyme
MNSSEVLTLLMSEQAHGVFAARVEQVMMGRPYRIVNLQAKPDSTGDFGVDIAFLSRDVTANSGKTVLAPSLERFYEIIRGSSKLSWLQMHAAGADRPIYREMINKGATVTTASGANAGPVAQMAVTGILALARCLPQLMESQRRKAWEPLLGAGAPRDLSTQTVMVVGWGPIGQEVARLCRCIGTKIIGVRREAGEAEGADEIIAFEDVPSRLPGVDWVVLACPLNHTTRGLLNAKTLNLLPEGARVVNVSRGEVIVESELINAVQSGHIGGAFLDVFEKEPLSDESPLWTLPNVIVSPHTAGHTQGHYAAVGEIFLNNLGKWLQSASLRNLVR